MNQYDCNECVEGYFYDLQRSSCEEQVTTMATIWIVVIVCAFVLAFIAIICVVKEHRHR